MKKGIAIIILAAGPSSRMGQSKQLLIIGNKPLLTRVAEIALSTGIKKVVVVLGSNAEEHRKALQGLKVELVVHPEWERGIGSSLKAGICFLQEKWKGAQAAIISVCDQPFLSSDHFQKLIERYKKSGKAIVASYYSNSPGVPCLFDQKYFPQLQNLQDNEGAKIIIREFPDDVAHVDFKDGEFDLDTLKDYDAYKKRLDNP